jgi:hypothetical protein
MRGHGWHGGQDGTWGGSRKRAGGARLDGALAVPACAVSNARGPRACVRWQGLFTKLLYGPGEECTSDGLYCFSGLPGEDAFEVFDVNADDKFSSMYGVDTRYGGGKGVAGEAPVGMPCLPASSVLPRSISDGSLYVHSLCSIGAFPSAFV